MRRHGLPVAIVLAAVLVGCGQEKEIPPTVVQPNAARAIAPDPFGPPPAESDPKAKGVLGRAAQAIAQGDAARLAKVKTSVVEHKGSVYLPVNATATPGTLGLRAAWPDRALVRFDFNGVVDTITFRFTRPEGWVVPNPAGNTATPAEMGRFIHADLVARYALPLGLLLADARTVAFDLQTADSGTTVKIAVPDLPDPVFRVTFDEKTGLPTKVEYHPVEFRDRVSKVATFADHKAHGELLLPSSTTLTHNGKPAEKWTLEKWEFPEKIDPAVFEVPK
jgi:hypothetical protein